MRNTQPRKCFIPAISQRHRPGLVRRGSIPIEERIFSEAATVIATVAQAANSCGGGRGGFYRQSPATELPSAAFCKFAANNQRSDYARALRQHRVCVAVRFIGVASLALVTGAAAVPSACLRCLFSVMAPSSLFLCGRTGRKSELVFCYRSARRQRV